MVMKKSKHPSIKNQIRSVQRRLQKCLQAQQQQQVR